MLPRCPFCSDEQPDLKLCHHCYSIGERGVEIHAGALFPGGLEVGEFVGSGGVASVYRAKSRRRPEEQLVVRFHHLGKREHNEVFERFQRGIDVVKNLRSPHLPRVYEIGRLEEPPIAFAVMEFIPHPNLRNYLEAQSASLSLRDKLGVLRLIAVALAAPHDSGLVHRDIKPDNIMVEVGPGNQATHIWLLDFDTVRIREHSELKEQVKVAKVTQKGRRIGTPEYMAPEVCNGDAKDAGPESDLYSLGIILFEMLTGRVPFDRTDFKVFEIYQAHIEKPVLPLLGPIGNTLPGGVKQLLAKLTAKKQELRVSSAAKVIELVDRCLAELPPEGAAGNSRPRPRSDRPARIEAADPNEDRPQDQPQSEPRPDPRPSRGWFVRLLRSPFTVAAVLWGVATWKKRIRIVVEDRNAAV